MAHIQMCLLVTFSIAAANLKFYTPQITSSSLKGKVTTTTVVLEMPQCVFNKNSSNDVWLIVANSTMKLSEDLLNVSAPYSSFAKKGYYRTFHTTENTFPCSNMSQDNQSFIRVGDETVCSNSENCNGPLTSPGPYKMKFVVLNSTRLVDQTDWSAPITLRTGKSATAIDTWPGARSGGMIVITSILSVLLAVFLACLIGTFIIGSKNLIYAKKMGSKEKTVIHKIDMNIYKTHHLQTTVANATNPSSSFKP